jgi:hypothetical protein
MSPVIAAVTTGLQVARMDLLVPEIGLHVLKRSL